MGENNNDMINGIYKSLNADKPDKAYTMFCILWEWFILLVGCTIEDKMKENGKYLDSN